MSATEREESEYRAEDDIKNLPKGQMQILMTDDAVAHCTRFCTYARRRKCRCRGSNRGVARLRQSRADRRGANLRFKDQKLAATITLPRR